MSLDEKLAQRFVCAKCKQRGAAIKRIAATGTGLTRFIDIQTNRFISVSCTHCGFTELYDQEILEGRDHAGDVLDFLFGG